MNKSNLWNTNDSKPVKKVTKEKVKSKTEDLFLLELTELRGNGKQYIAFYEDSEDYELSAVPSIASKEIIDYWYSKVLQDLQSSIKGSKNKSKIPLQITKVKDKNIGAWIKTLPNKLY